MQQLLQGLETWSGIITDRESRRRALALVRHLLAAIADVSKHGRYGSYSIELDAEAGKIVRWRHVHKESHA